ncbi:hypothetical protein E0765_00040 [Sulfuricurvum sp. IAE1]|uniref:hypothetical protein n=1 Tax=Sulfuricurvum sp. IAE1 TaxID=2546102 RepID=UPI00104C717C|nr:hypothetical protein [Sulfuricurvum sp. IAE1]TDA69670.1 hypothetical protein E0765_00040 [Sulfuricurvum sp. IAE1]
MPLILLYVFSAVLLLVSDVDGVRTELFNGEMSVWSFFLLLVPVVSFAVFLALISIVVLLNMLWMMVETPLRWVSVELYVLVMRIWYYGRLIFMSRQRRSIEYEKTRPALIELKRLRNRMEASMREPTPDPVETDEQKKSRSDLWGVAIVLAAWALLSGG